MLYSGTNPESYITEYTLVYEDQYNVEPCGSIRRHAFSLGGGRGGRESEGGSARVREREREGQIDDRLQALGDQREMKFSGNIAVEGTWPI